MLMCGKVALFAEVKENDIIYWAEYCNQVVDDEYVDGRMTWEPIETKWIKEKCTATSSLPKL